MNTSPMTMLERLSWRVRHNLHLCLVADVLDSIAKRERRGLAHASKEQSETVAGVHAASSALSEAMQDNVITIEEARHVARHLIQAKIDAHQTTEAIKHLAS